jgi:hypothetical protein
MRRVFPFVLLVVAALVAAAAAPVAAHTVPAAPALVIVPALTESLTSAAPAPTPPWGVIAVVVVAALVVAWRPRRVIALALVLVASVLAFETGVHSAHHLGQAEDAARCVVAGMTAQLSADLVDTTLDAQPLLVLERRLPALASPVVAARSVAPDAGRAPPALSA